MASEKTFGREWRTFGAAREFVHRLGLRTRSDWREYCKFGEKPGDIPASPRDVYEEFTSWGDWLGQTDKRPARREWRSFEDAREFVRGLGLKGKVEWETYAKSDKRPADIPSSPHHVYEALWKGWKDWVGTQWRPFEEAREFARGLGLNNRQEWAEYCKSGKKPANIPAYPEVTYKTEFRGVGDWLGTGTVAKQNRKWRGFFEARRFAHELRLKSGREWREYAKSGEKPDDIPASPQAVYKSDWDGWGDWLGTGNVRNREWRPFAEAREFVRALGLKSGDDWREYARSGEKPEDIPSSPPSVYEADWNGWSDWLGTGNVRNREWRPFEEARAFVRVLGLKSEREWRDYCKSGEKPKDIPAYPIDVYERYEGLSDWIWHVNVYSSNREWMPFEEARAFVRRLGLKNKNEWDEYARSGEKPENIPARPQVVYKTEYMTMGDWLGTGFVRTADREYRSFSEARAFVHTLGLSGQNEWRKKYVKSGDLPADIPSNPDRVYGPEFMGWGDWFGTGTVHWREVEWRPFEEARAFVRGLSFRTTEEWKTYAKSEEKPDDIPANPPGVYDEFRGFGDWLGIINKWTKAALLALLGDLRPRLPYLEESELYTILQQGGALPALRAVFEKGNGSWGQALRDLKANEGRGVEQAIRGTSDEEIADHLGTASADEGVADERNPAALQTTRIFERDGEGTVRPTADSPSTNGAAIADADSALIALATDEGLRVIDSLAELPYGLDDEAAEYLVVNRVSALWEVFINEGRERVDEILLGGGGPWFTEIKTRFLSEVDSVESLAVPEGWSFSANGKPAVPNAMQRRAAWAVREKERVGNWSGTGSGKTLSAVLASRVIDARCTLVVTNNATVEGWRRQIKQAYPDSVVLTRVDDGLTLDLGHHNYIILNYEKFQTSGRNHLVHLLLDLGIDFVVIDEVQLVKQRDGGVTKRREALAALLSNLAEKTPSLRVMGMSATPVINNLLEAKNLLEIVIGLHFLDLNTRATVDNALAVHRALMVYGFRYRPRYEVEMRTTLVPTSRNDLLKPLRDVGNNILEVEQILLPAKLEAVKKYIRKGTVLYTHYVDGMVAPIRRYLEATGFTVGLYTGNDKSGLGPFLRREVDVLIGSRPVGTGLDGLQYVCDRLVIVCLPWTGAEYEQIVGRVRRQGSVFGQVDIIVPQVMLDHEGQTWSWDRGRMACIHYKRTLSDCAVDGHIPETVRISPNELLKQSREALDRWIERIGDEGLLAVERGRLAVPLPPDIRQKVQVRHGDFGTLNGRWNTSRSDTVHERLQKDSSEWYLYHTMYREARESWPEHPFERIAERIRMRPDWVVGDFGCGECLLAQTLPDNKVIGIDHVACDESVLECDMSDAPLEDSSLDVAVFSLSLMGTNWKDYLREANRTLKPYGHLLIAEPLGRWQNNPQHLQEAVEEAGFCVVGDIEQRYDFLYLAAVKV